MREIRIEPQHFADLAEAERIGEGLNERIVRAQPPDVAGLVQQAVCHAEATVTYLQRAYGIAAAHPTTIDTARGVITTPDDTARPTMHNRVGE